VSGALGVVGILFGLFVLADPLSATLALSLSLAVVLIAGGSARRLWWLPHLNRGAILALQGHEC
jgi:uncharacterized membrane protein HdeD (DUF308 family)